MTQEEIEAYAANLKQRRIALDRYMFELRLVPIGALTPAYIPCQGLNAMLDGLDEMIALETEGLSCVSPLQKQLLNGGSLSESDRRRVQEDRLLRPPTHKKEGRRCGWPLSGSG